MPLSPNTRHDTASPTSVTRLMPAERFLIQAVRRWVLGWRENESRHWAVVWDDFTRQFGAANGQDALAGFAALVKELHCHARRVLRYHQPGCSCLGADELCVIRLVAACQHRQITLARSLAQWLAQPDGAGDLFAAALRLARVMHRNALILSINIPSDKRCRTSELSEISNAIH